MEQKTYKYDAFISYRHLPAETAVAHRLQRILEGYAAPRGTPCEHTVKIRRVFVDTTEMPNIPDLTRGILEALEESRYLIVLGSPALRESEWCHAEVLRFKEMNGGSAAHIIPVLVSGDPSQVFFSEMRVTTRSYLDIDGRELFREEPIEPLYTDIRSKSTKDSLQRLKKEKLRIAAPLLGCGYDDLFRRHRRRAIQRGVLTASATCVAAVGIGAALVKLDADRRDASATLQYTRAADAIQADDPALGMRLLVDSLAESPRDPGPQSTSLSLLMQGTSWPVAHAPRTGVLAGGAMLVTDMQEGEASQGFVRLESSIDPAAVLAYDAAAQVLLTATQDGYTVRRMNGETLRELSPSVGLFTGADQGAGCFVFSGTSTGADTTQTWIYAPAADTLAALETAVESSEDPYAISSVVVANVLAYAEGSRALAVYPKRIDFYQLEEDAWRLNSTMDMLALFDEDFGLSIQKAVIHPAGNILAVTNGRYTAMVNLLNESLWALDKQTDFSVQSLAFSNESPLPHYLAIAYGVPESTDLERGGGIAIWGVQQKARAYGNESKEQMAVRSVQFGLDSQCVTTVDYSDTVSLWQMQEGDLLPVMLPAKAEGRSVGAMPGGNGLFTVDNGDGTLTAYGALVPREQLVADLQDDRLALRALLVDDEGPLLLTQKEIVRVDLSTGALSDRSDRATEAYRDVVQRHAFGLQDERVVLSEQGVQATPAWVENAALSRVMEDLREMDASQAQPGSILKESRITQDGKSLFCIGSTLPYLARYAVDDATQTLTLAHLSALPLWMTPSSLFLLRDDQSVAISMVNGEIYLYDANRLDTPVAIFPSMGGEKITKVDLDASGSYLAVAIADRLLIWHVPTKSLAYDQDFSGDTIGMLCFVDGSLYYGRSSRLYRLILLEKRPSEARVAFFDALCGYTVDSFGIARRKAPAPVDALSIPADDWSLQYTLVNSLKEVDAL